MGTTTDTTTRTTATTVTTTTATTTTTSSAVPMAALSKQQGGWLVCAVLGENLSQGAYDWLDDVWSASSGDYNFMDSRGMVRHMGNACPGLTYGSGVQLKGRALRRPDSRPVFETQAVNFPLNPWTRGPGAHIYGAGYFGFKDGNGAEVAKPDDHSYQCSTGRNHHNTQGPSICISDKRSRSLNMVSDGNDGGMPGVQMCLINHWCGNGNMHNYIVILYKRSSS